jgi:hypothetical protein
VDERPTPRAEGLSWTHERASGAPIHGRHCLRRHAGGCRERLLYVSQILGHGCAGLDVHKDTVVACVRIQESASARHVVESFGTTTKELLRLADWLAEHEVTHVAMEATGVYWKPVWHVLEESFELVLANAMHIKNFRGRKTDVNGATWIADLLAHGLIRGTSYRRRRSGTCERSCARASSSFASGRSTSSACRRRSKTPTSRSRP